MVEYSDMISQFVDKRKCPAIDVVFLDEVPKTHHFLCFDREDLRARAQVQDESTLCVPIGGFRHSAFIRRG